MFYDRIGAGSMGRPQPLNRSFRLNIISFCEQIMNVAFGSEDFKLQPADYHGELQEPQADV